MTNEKTIIPARLAKARVDKHWTQAQLCDQLIEEVGPGAPLKGSYISMLETGKRKVPKKYNKILAKILDVTEEYLLGISNDPHETASSEPDYEYTYEKMLISYENLFKFDGMPVFVEFLLYTHDPSWGIYDHRNQRIVFRDFIYKLDLTCSQTLRISVFSPEYIARFKTIKKQTMDYDTMMRADKIYIIMNSPDIAIRNRYNGWYRHNELKTCLINSVGLTLPYDGFNISYSAYNLGTENIADLDA